MQDAFQHCSRKCLTQLYLYQSKQVTREEADKHDELDIFFFCTGLALSSASSEVYRAYASPPSFVERLLMITFIDLHGPSSTGLLIPFSAKVRNSHCIFSNECHSTATSFIAVIFILKTSYTVTLFRSFPRHENNLAACWTCD